MFTIAGKRGSNKRQIKAKENEKESTEFSSLKVLVWMCYMKVYHSREYPDSIDTVSHHRRRRFKVWEQKKKSPNTCSHSVYVQKLDKGLNTRLNHLSRHSILVRCKQSLPSVYTLGLCAFEIISHSWNTSLSQYGWENWLFPFLPCNPSLSSLIFTPDSVWLCGY